MDINVLTVFERKALLEFIKDYINRDNLSIYEDSTIKHLFLAYLKLQIEEDKYQEAMGYTE